MANRVEQTRHFDQAGCKRKWRVHYRSRASAAHPVYLAGYNVWPSQVRRGPVGGSVDKSLTMHRAGLQILVTSASPY